MSEFYKALCQGSVIEISKRSSRRLREVLSKCQGRVQQVREASKLRNAFLLEKVQLSFLITKGSLILLKIGSYKVQIK